MERREFITLLGGAAATWPLTAHAQQSTSTIRRIGILLPESVPTAEARGLLEAFRQGLKELDWVEGQNIAFEYRSADGKEDALPKIAAELVQLRLDAILAEGTAAIQAAKDATQSIPIVMATSNDPVASGLIASLNQPGGNVTGLSLQSSELAGKRLQLLTEIVPKLARLVVLSNPTNPSHALAVQQMRAAAQSFGIGLHVVEASAPDKFESAFATVAAVRAVSLVVLPDGMFFGQHRRIVALTTASHLPALFPEKEVAEAGGLMAYGPSIPASFRRAAAYVDKILRGGKPADLPVEQPTKFELAINLKTAKTLGLAVPQTLLVAADEVIE
jgi:putative tryptophan/tyrosine transport system substrate-binding protein